MSFNYSFNSEFGKNFNIYIPRRYTKLVDLLIMVVFAPLAVPFANEQVRIHVHCARNALFE